MLSAALADPLTLVAIALIAIVAALVGGVGGFGSGIILSVGLVPIVGFKAIVPILAVAGLVINMSRLWFYRRHVERRYVVLVVGVAVPLLFVGTWFYAQLDGRTIGFILGVVTISFVPLRRWLRSREMHFGTAGIATGAAAFGLASGVTSGTGVILIATLMGAGLTGPAVLATDAIISVLVDAARAALFGKFAVLDAESAMMGLVVGLVSLPGSALAAKIVANMKASVHAAAMEVLIIAGGASILWQAAHAA